MSKFNEWLKPMSHKIIAAVIAVAVLIGGGYGIFVLTGGNKKASITFASAVNVEYGQRSTEDFADPKQAEYEGIDVLQPLSPESVIEVENSEFDVVSFSPNAEPKTRTAEDAILIDSSKVGLGEGTLYAKRGRNVSEIKFSYIVRDTLKPILENVENVDLKVGDEFKTDFRAYDVVDGDLEITYIGEYDMNKAGSYKLVASVEDKHQNKTEKIFFLNVK